MKKIILIFTLIIISINLFAFEQYFSGDDYTARVNEWGLVSLVIGGEEFISSEGCYFFNDPNYYTGTCTPTVEGNKFICKTDIASVEYEFLKDRINFVFKNETGSDYFIRLSHFAQPITSKRIHKNNSVLECDCEFKIFAHKKNRPELDFLARWHSKAHIRETLRPSRLTEEEKNYIYPQNFDFTLYSPKNYEVFQRQTKDFGNISFTGKTSSKVTDISYKIDGKDYKGKNVNITKSIKPNKYGEIKENINVPAGGWYKFTYSYKLNGEIINKTIDNVGVGEVIIGAGQSNAANNAELPSKQESGMVSSSDGINWQYGNDPQLGPLGRAQGGSLYPSLGDALYKEFNVPIGFQLVSCGGTLSEQWQSWSFSPQGNINLYSYMMNRINKLGENGFRCLIWHQGEGDVGSDEKLFYSYMAYLINRSRHDANFYIPWFTAKASYHNPEHPSYENVRRVHQRLWDEGISYQGPDTDTLTSEYREFNGTGIHLNLKGLKKHGEMWAEYLIPYIHEQID